jgi:hypothetical protein
MNPGHVPIPQLRKLIYRCAYRDVKTHGQITPETQAMARAIQIRKATLKNLKKAKKSQNS